MKRVYISAYPFVTANASIDIPDNEDEYDYINNHFDEIKFEPTELDYCGCDVEVVDVEEHIEETEGEVA